MKIRNGFVSNSSSTSFICVGARMKRTDITDAQVESLENCKLECRSPNDTDDWVVGDEIACWDECDGTCAMTVQELNEIVKKVQRKLNKVFGRNKYRSEICYGVRMS